MKAIKTIFGALAITMALAVHVQAQSFLTNGLVAYYPLNGNANDASGNGNNGTVVGAVPATDRFGNPTGCYSFNGNAQYIYAAAGSLPSGQRTISLWFKLNEVNIHPVLLGYGRSCGSSYWMGLNLAGKAAFTVGTHCGGYELDVPYNVPPTNSWKQWVVVMSTNQTIFYLNGNLLGSEAGSPTTAVAGTQLGLGVATGNGDSGTVPYTDSNLGYLDGYLDDVRIYNRALSASEVQQLYNYDVTPSISNPGLSAGNFSFNFNALSNLSYTVQQNTNLTTTNWIYCTNVIGAGRPYQFITPTASRSQNFYRVKTP